MNFFTIILILIIILAIITIVSIVNYNNIQFFKTRINVSENNIDEALRKKYDLMCELNVEIKKVNNKNLLKDFINLKDKNISNFEFDRKLIEAFNLIKEIKYDYKKLDNEIVNNLLENVYLNDEKLESNKNYYNKNITHYNSLIRKFPSNIIAKILKYKTKLYFDNKNTEDNVIDDFKL